MSGRVYFDDEIGKVGGSRQAEVYEPIQAQLNNMDSNIKRKLAQLLNVNIDDLASALVRQTGSGSFTESETKNRLADITKRALLRNAPEARKYAGEHSDSEEEEPNEDEEEEKDEYYIEFM